jgi:hypothetical protein
MSDTPETDALYMDDHRPNLMDHARRLERERDQLLHVIRNVDCAFPDLAEFQDKDGRSLKWLADKIQKAKGEA